MCLIFGASTSLGAPHHTSRFIEPLLHWLFPHITQERVDVIHHAIRKMAHFTEYGVLGMWTWRLVRNDPLFSRASVKRQFWFALLFCLFYASTDEFHQKFVRGREPAVMDGMIDTSGATCGLMVAWWIGRRFASRRATQP
jgi:VanZ family protein